jgi:hypothetical protein
MSKCAEYGVPVGTAVKLMQKLAAKPDYDRLSAKELDRLWNNNGWIDGAIGNGRIPMSARTTSPRLRAAGSESMGIFGALQEAMAGKYGTFDRMKRAQRSRDMAEMARRGNKGILRSVKNLVKRLVERGKIRI